MDIFKGWLDMDEVGYLKHLPDSSKTKIEGVFERRCRRQGVPPGGDLPGPAAWPPWTPSATCRRQGDPLSPAAEGDQRNRSLYRSTRRSRNSYDTTAKAREANRTVGNRGTSPCPGPVLMKITW